MEDNKPSSLWEFRQTACRIPLAVYESAYGVKDAETAPNVIVYDNYAVIADNVGATYSTAFENDSVCDADLQLVEAYLWDGFVKWEYQISEDACREDLDSRACDILERLDLECSLDEVDLKRCNENTKEEIQYLLNQFDKHDEHFNVKKEPNITHVAVMDYRAFKITTYRIPDVNDGDEIEAWLKVQGTYHDDCHYLSSNEPIETINL